MMKHGHAAGRSPTRTYITWAAMVQRCTDPNATSYPLYGARGIAVCERWRWSFENFLADMGERPAGTSIDRIDSNADYEAENCRWATPKRQARNRSTSVVVRHGEVTASVAELAESHGHPPRRVYRRMRDGWSLAKALETPAFPHGGDRETQNQKLSR